MLLHVISASLLFLANTTPSYEGITFCLNLHQLMSILVVSERETLQVQTFNIIYG